jgi:CRISPR-associated protein Cmr4
MSNKRILYVFTRTPLHVGAGASVGAIDQPVQRERHTGFPIIPATSLKGAFADAWSDGLFVEKNSKGETQKVRVTNDGKAGDAAWLFGSDSDKHAAAGALQFSEARLLAFPIRSAKGSFAWITCPLMLQRAARDGVLSSTQLEMLQEPKDEQAIFDNGSNSKLAISGQIVLEEYTFKAIEWSGLSELSRAFAALVEADPVWSEVKDRLVVLNNGMMSFFANSACEIAQHVRIDDETGTAAGGALFNQENVPSESLFYSVLHALDERTPGRSENERRKAEGALKVFGDKAAEMPVFQFGGDASTGLGYCTVTVTETKGI